MLTVSLVAVVISWVETMAGCHLGITSILRLQVSLSFRKATLLFFATALSLSLLLSSSIKRFWFHCLLIVYNRSMHGSLLIIWSIWRRTSHNFVKWSCQIGPFDSELLCWTINFGALYVYPITIIYDRYTLKVWDSVKQWMSNKWALSHIFYIICMAVNIHGY